MAMDVVWGLGFDLLEVVACKALCSGDRGM